MPEERDQDKGKGATESEVPDRSLNVGLRDQLGHRDQDPIIKGSDTDFPEPGESPEHTGEPKRKSA
jgi:hypothetical protein